MATSSNSREKYIMKESNELMRNFPSKRLDVSFRNSHTLLPSLTSVPIDQQNAPSPLESLFMFNQPQRTPSNHVSFEYGWRNPQENWSLWVRNMHSRFQDVWRRAGIYDSIWGSVYQVHKNLDLLFVFGEKWCPKTNTFVFPWGEATITLEDVFVLGGYSLLGECVVTSAFLVSEDEVRINDRLLEAYREGVRTPSRKTTHPWWLEQFMGKGSEVEHEAFLALWLSRYVFPGSNLNNIVKEVFPLAIRLARGIQVCLAPAVLASIYRDLRSLKNATILEMKDGDSPRVKIQAPFLLVQLWVWERFPTLQPRPNVLRRGEPRISRWGSTSRGFSVQDIQLAIRIAAPHFLWRPYAKALDGFVPPAFYSEEEELELIGQNVSGKAWLLVLCIRPSVLVGLKGLLEHYFPHRVAMQFGYDQDIPATIEFKTEDHIVAWRDFTRRVEDRSLYIPSKNFVAGVTDRYDTWWKVFMECTRIKGLEILRT
ncbi:protein MAINTENANCE OF MERISTEMS-like [Nicotiana tomentosiformis]|uniref:protein MAINTENANCE OF MERISTEMS-like n=1 Tax=Nicotiana tomentosiformis TaxID=4098 RepID=UPI00051C8263|nr:serine/threonine-protein phosphatase 7 long form homolog [Nicotiana tomentosiformis]